MRSTGLYAWMNARVYGSEHILAQLNQSNPTCVEGVFQLADLRLSTWHAEQPHLTQCYTHTLQLTNQIEAKSVQSYRQDGITAQHTFPQLTELRRVRLLMTYTRAYPDTCMMT